MFKAFETRLLAFNHVFRVSDRGEQILLLSLEELYGEDGCECHSHV